MLLELSRPAFAMEVIRDDDSCGAVTETDELREWLFTQTVAVSNRPSGSAITMLFLVFVMFLTLIQRWLVERKVHY